MDLCLDLQDGKPKQGMIIRTPSKWEPNQESKPRENEHKTRWEARPPGNTDKWG